MQANLFWIWLARNFNFWEWTLLYCGCFYQCNECILFQWYHKLTLLPTIQSTCWNVLQIVKSLFYKAKQEGKDLFKCLMIYHNTPLSGSLQSPMQILQSRCTRCDPLMCKTARMQLVLQPEKLRPVYKNEHLPSHDLHIGQDVMYQDATSKQWYLPTITSLCVQLRSYNITTKEGVTYQKHKITWSPSNLHARKQKVNILVIVCRL